MTLSVALGDPWHDEDLEMRQLVGQPEAGFDCGEEEQNRFLYERAWRDAKRGVTSTHLLYVKGILAAYVTLMMDAITLGPLEKPKGVSWRQVGALKIAQLGVDGRFAGRGLGKRMVAYVIHLARVFRPQAGCRFVTTDAVKEMVPWYEAQGFQRNLENQEHRRQFAASQGRDPDSLPVSMRFDLRDITDYE